MVTNPFHIEFSQSGEPQVAGQSRLLTLSPQQLDVLRMLCSGNSSQEVAHALKISPITVDGLTHRIKQKLRLDQLARLGVLPIRQGSSEREAA